MASITKTETTRRQLSAESVQNRADAAAKLILAARLCGNTPYLDPAEGERALADLDASADEIRGVLRDLRDHVAAEATEQDVGRAIATLIGVFGTPAGANAKIYTSVMIERVARQQPSIAALDQAVQQLIGSCRFPPAIAEVLDALSARQAPISSRLELLSQVDDVRDRLARRIEHRLAEFARFRAGNSDR